MDVNNDIEFNKWLKKVDNYIYSILKINLTDLPDNSFRIDFDEGMSYKDMADKTLKDTMWEELYLELKHGKNFILN